MLNVELLENRKKVTQKLLDSVNATLEEIKEEVKNEVGDWWRVRIGDIILDHEVSASGFTHDGIYFSPNVDFDGDYDLPHTNGYFPDDVSELGTGYYYAGNYNCWVQYINRSDLVYVANNLKKWIAEYNSKVKSETKQIEELLKDL